MTRRSPPPCPYRGLWPRRGPQAFFHSTGIDNTMNIHATMAFRVKVMCKLIKCSSREKNPPINARLLKRVAVFHTCLFTVGNGRTREERTPQNHRSDLQNMSLGFTRFLFVYYSASGPPALVREMRAPLIHPKIVQINFSVSPTTVRQFSGCPKRRKIN